MITSTVCLPLNADIYRKPFSSYSMFIFALKVQSENELETNEIKRMKRIISVERMKSKNILLKLILALNSFSLLRTQDRYAKCMHLSRALLGIQSFDPFSLADHKNSGQFRSSLKNALFLARIETSFKTFQSCLELVLFFRTAFVFLAGKNGPHCVVDGHFKLHQSKRSVKK